VYREKEDYGETPHYLKLRKQELEHQAMQKQLAAERSRNADPTDFQPLSEQDRRQILSALKLKRDQLMLEYGKLPLVIDTVPKKNRYSVLVYDVQVQFDCLGNRIWIEN
jgi:hypothetical protein